MAEPDERDYGRYCKHGTNIGTPGGSDFLCGDCEMGRDTLIEVVRWEVKVGIIDLTEDGQCVNKWGMSSILHTADREKALRQIDQLVGLVDESNARSDGNAKHLLCLGRVLLAVWVSADEIEAGDIVLAQDDEDEEV